MKNFVFVSAAGACEKKEVGCYKMCLCEGQTVQPAARERSTLIATKGRRTISKIILIVQKYMKTPFSIMREQSQLPRLLDRRAGNRRAE